MFSILTGLIVSCLFLLAVLGTVLAVMSVLEHVRNDPAAAKAIYEHVFLPIFVGTPDAKPEGEPAVNAASAATEKKPDGPEWEC